MRGLPVGVSHGWLGQIPNGWTVKRLGALGTLVKGSGGTKEDNCDVGVPVVRYGDLYTKFDVTIAQPTAFVSEEDAAKYTPLSRHSIVFAASGESAEDIGKSAVSLLEEPTVVGGDTVVLRPAEGVDPLFLAYALESAPVRALKAVRASGFTVVHISAGRLKTIPVPLPPLDQQRVIADYLDRETARIDTLILQQQQLIVTLGERREAAVRSVLLSGLDSAPVAPSGVDALGSIPRHWRMIPTRYLCKITTGSEDSGNATDDGDFPFYVRGREILRIDHFSFDGEAVMTPGDGQGGTGKVFHYFAGKFEAHQRVYVFKDFEGITGRYFFYFLSTFLRPVALAGSNTVTMESLRRPLLADFKMAVPPLSEQGRIVRYLDAALEKIEALIGETERFIELSRERRAALITSAVTGQIDVRGSA